MKKPGRNDPCVCGSGKKFKKCCENKMLGKKYFAQDLTQKFSGKFNLTSLFQDTAPEKPREEASENKNPPEENKSESDKTS